MGSITETKGGVVYLLTSPSGKQYVGQAWNLPKRLRQYRRGADKSQRAMHAAIRKYGWDNFTVAIIVCGIQTQDALDKTESAFIALLDTMSPHGYNLTSGGNGGKRSDETRAKMSASHTGKPKSPESIEKTAAAWRGRKHFAETKAKLRAINLGKKHTEETRAKMRASQPRGENHPNYGREFSAEHRAKLSAAKLGKKRGPYNKRKSGV